MLPEVVSQGQLPSDVSPEDRYAWDASAGAHRVLMADARHLDLSGADAEKSVDLEPAVRALDGSPLDDSQLAVPA